MATLIVCDLCGAGCEPDRDGGPPRSHLVRVPELSRLYRVSVTAVGPGGGADRAHDLCLRCRMRVVQLGGLAAGAERDYAREYDRGEPPPRPGPAPAPFGRGDVRAEMAAAALAARARPRA